MSNTNIYYYLSMRGLDPCSLTPSNYINAKKTWLCEGCKRPKPHIKGVDVILQDTPPRKTALNIVFGVGVGIACRQFLEDIGWPLVERDLYIGKVFNEKLKELTDFVSFMGRRTLIVRGSRNANFRVCPKCGMLGYFGMQKWYLIGQPFSGTDIFESHSHQLVLSPDAYAAFPHEKWKRSMYLTKLEVLETSLDGFGDLKIPDRN